MIKDIIKGIKEYGKALILISKLKLWKYFIVPICISFFVGITIMVFAYAFSDNLSTYVSGLWKWDFARQTFNYVSTFISGFCLG